MDTKSHTCNAMKLNDTEKFEYLAICLEGFLLGLYSGIFSMYLKFHASKEGANIVRKGLLFYALCVLFVLSAAVVGFDIAIFVVAVNPDTTTLVRLDIITSGMFGFCDFIAQSILIYRCWIVWDCNIHVVIIPSILTLGFFVMVIAVVAGAAVIGQNGLIAVTDWGNTLILIGLTMSMTVNALMTGLIVFKIFQVFREVKGLNDNTSGDTSGRKFWSVMFIIIESGMALFSIQLARLVVTNVSTEAANAALNFIVTIHQMVNGITPTIILVRVSMGLSFHDETSLVEVSSSLQFAPVVARGTEDESLRIGPDHPNPIPEIGSIGRDDDIGGSDDIQMDPMQSKSYRHNLERNPVGSSSL